MPDLDATAIAAAESPGFSAAFFIYLDISGDPLRVTTYGKTITFAGTGDTDLDGNSFTAFGGKLLDIGDISNSESGSDTFTLTLSGIVSMDSSLLNDIGDKTLWQGRTCRVWMQLYDETGAVEQGAIIPLKLGYMSSVSIGGRPGDQSISLSVENWLAAFNQASNRSYLNQKDYDSSDTSAQATIAAANGMRRDSGASSGFAGGGFGSGPGGGGAGQSATTGIGGGLGGGAYGGYAGDGIAPVYINSR